MNKTKYRFNVSILLKCRGGYWIAQGLEYDIAAKGKTIDDARSEFERLFAGQIFADIKVGNEPLEHTKPAPEDLQSEFQSAVTIAGGPRAIRIPDLHSIQSGILPFIAARAEEYRVA